MSLDRVPSSSSDSSERTREVETIVRRVGDKVAQILESKECGDLALSAYEEINYVRMFAETNSDVISSELLDKSRIYDDPTMEGKIRHWFSDYIESSVRPGVEKRGDMKELAALENLVRKLKGNLE